jgi:hypothetical protein
MLARADKRQEASGRQSRLAPVLRITHLLDRRQSTAISPCICVGWISQRK